MSCWGEIALSEPANFNFVAGARSRLIQISWFVRRNCRRNIDRADRFLAHAQETNMTQSDMLHDDAPASAAKDSKTQQAAAGRDRENAVIGRAVTINKPAQEIYDFFRNFANLVGVMENIERIDVIDDKRSHWVVSAPGGQTVEWDSEVTEDEPGRLIAWRSVGDASVSNSGRVEFTAAPPGRGTYVTATIAYDPPAGGLGQLIAKLFQQEPRIQSRRDMRRLKQLLEAGEIATTTPPNRAPVA
jgi:uncharacterized membrane protein